MKISIITPVRNGRNFIGRTMDSVLSQTAVISGRVDLEYIVVDGASDDDTLDVIHSRRHASIHVISERDKGMYDALAKGFRIASGDVVAYINAGDHYHESAFDIVQEVFCNSSVSWATATNFQCNEALQITNFFQPIRYKGKLIRRGMYGTTLPPIQQESTFWRRSLLELINFDRLSSLRYAGDFYLWHCFSIQERLWIVRSFLGAFTVHRGQLSEVSRREYDLEFEQIVSKSPSILWNTLGVFERVLHYVPSIIRRKLGIEQLIVFNHQRGVWHQS